MISLYQIIPKCNRTKFSEKSKTGFAPLIKPSPHQGKEDEGDGVSI